MQMAVLAIFIAILTLDRLVLFPLPAWGLGLAVIVYLAVAAGVAYINTRWSLLRVAREDEVTSASLKKHGLLTMVSQLWLVLGTVGLLLCGWNRGILAGTLAAWMPLIGKLVTVAPFVAAVLVTWAVEYPFYRVYRTRLCEHEASAMGVRRRVWTFGEYLGYNTRHHLLFVIVPISMIIFAQDCLMLYASGPLRQWLGDRAEIVLAVTSGLCALGVFTIVPAVVVRIWKTAPLPDGELRRQLEDMCRRLGLRYRDILVWRTGGMIANAGVMGIVAPVRYVLLSDALLEHMDSRHVRTIFAHEAGHIANHHLLYLALFALNSVVACWLVGALLEWALPGGLWWAGQMAGLVALAAVWLVGFGWLSRRFERQSDVTAAWMGDGSSEPRADGTVTSEGAATFSWALQQVAQLNGVSRDQRNWRHGTVTSRLSYILWLGSSGGGRGMADRTVARIKIALWLATVGGAAAVTASCLW